MRMTTDVAIVGGGVIGCSIAYYLARRGIKSIVFEQHRLASGASGATAGLITPLWHVDHTHRALFDMGLRSLNAFPDLAADLAESGADPGLRQCGVLKVAVTQEEAETLKDDFAWQGEMDLGVTWLDPDEIFEREPELSQETLGGVFSPHEGYVSGQRLVDSLMHAATQRGATLLEGEEVSGLETDGRRVTGVRTAKDVCHAENTVLAAGPWTGIANRWIDHPIPVRPIKGQRALLKKAGFLPDFVVHSFIGTAVPQTDGTILVGATRHEGQFDQEVTADAIMSILANAISILPTLKDASFVEARAGVRPGSPDNVPIIGPIPDWEGLSVASGHGGTGVMLAPGTAELIADYISTGNADSLEPFSVSRFDLET